jgi:pSer/pThr/pTyr-binding forkhead associated (FHA) protein/type II secretory pathway pseudopilin PulG
MAFLIQVNEGVKTVILPLGKAVILIGRDVDSNLYLDDSGISKNHASIVFSNETYTLKDNGSSSGSIVNGVRVTEHKISHDDIIQFGSYTFKVDLKNPIPVTTSTTENDVALQRSGHSYTRKVELEEIAGRESTGTLHVVMTDSPKTLPLPLPPTGFLANLSLQSRQDLSLRGIYRYARDGEILIHEGQNPGRLFILISGKWEARKLATQTVLGQIQPGEWVGEVNIFDPSGAMCSVVAVEPSEYWEITREAFEKFINESRSTGSAILIALAATLGRRIRQSTEGMEQAIAARPEPPPARRSRFTPVFAAIAVLAILAAAAFFLMGNVDKSRLQAEKEQIVHERAETLEEARQQLDALQDTMAKTNQELQKARSENEKLTKRLTATQQMLDRLNEAKSSIAPVAAPAATEIAPSATEVAHNEVLAKAEKLSGHPSKVIITKKTNVSLLVDGQVSGSAVLPEGLELPAVGAEGEFVIVEFGDAHQKIPKDHTNFAEALVAEAEAAKNRPAPEPTKAPVLHSEPKPPVAMPKVEPSKLHSDFAKKSSELSFEDLTSVLDDVKLLSTLDEFRGMKNASASDFGRFMRTLEPRWKRAAKDSASLLSLSGGRKEYREILKKIIEASEILDPARGQVFEAKLREIDGAWLKLKTEEKIQNLTGEQSSE